MHKNVMLPKIWAHSSITPVFWILLYLDQIHQLQIRCFYLNFAANWEFVVLLISAENSQILQIFWVCVVLK